MKRIFIIIISILISLSFCNAQDPLDSLITHIRKLEIKESEALAKGDLKTLYSIWDVNFVLNCNALTIRTKRIKETLPQIKFKYDYPSRSCDIHLIDANTAVVMGESLEQYITLPPRSPQPQIEFTDVWSKSTGDWKLYTRQVTYLK